MRIIDEWIAGASIGSRLPLYVQTPACRDHVRRNCQKLYHDMRNVKKTENWRISATFTKATPNLLIIKKEAANATDQRQLI